MKQCGMYVLQCSCHVKTVHFLCGTLNIKTCHDANFAVSDKFGIIICIVKTFNFSVIFDSLSATMFDPSLRYRLSFCHCLMNTLAESTRHCNNATKSTFFDIHEYVWLKCWLTKISLNLIMCVILGYRKPRFNSLWHSEATWCLRSLPQRTRDAIITSLLRQNDVVTSFWRNNDVIIASCDPLGLWLVLMICHCSAPYASIWTIVDLFYF